MVNTLVTARDMAKKQPSKKLARFELRVEEEWLKRIEKQADRFGLTVAAYIRQASQIKLEADEATDTTLDKA